jgi:hypothetical protein
MHLMIVWFQMMGDTPASLRGLPCGQPDFSLAFEDAPR